MRELHAAVHGDIDREAELVAIDFAFGDFGRLALRTGDGAGELGSVLLEAVFDLDVIAVGRGELAFPVAGDIGGEAEGGREEVSITSPRLVRMRSGIKANRIW